MSDRLTVLRSRGLVMAKTWKTDGSIEPYSKARNFTPEQHDIADIHELSALLSNLETQPNAFIIRGAPKHPNQPEMRRLIENIDDVPLHTVLIEVDDYRTVIADPLTETQDAALEYISDALPKPFHGASFHWQASNSMGAPGKDGLLKLHLWFWLATPYDSATLRAWATAINLACDKTVFNPAQIHYTSSPIFESGRVDPVPQRSGFHQGAHDSVDLVIDTTALSVRPQGERLRGERREVDDPVADWIERSWETYGTLTNGGLVVACPFEDHHHSGVKGDTSTVFFPAGTNSYAESRWVCKHDGCHGRSQGEFNAAAGYNPLAVLAEVPHLNGHVVDLPPFKRDAKGSIEPIIHNMKLAVDQAEFLGCALKFDRFRDEIVVVEEGADNWRAFVDEDYTKLRLKLETSDFKPLSSTDLRSVIHLSAAQRHFDSAIHWLSGIKWDGVPRIEAFWVDHFGVVDDTQGYARAVGLYTWTALAARAMDPGVQADMVPVLVGAQGVGKSRGVAAMSPVQDFATSMSFHETEVERARKMRGKLIVELAELQGLKSREREEILAWITRSVEHWTPKYMEMSTTFARRFICFATTNDDDFLDNPNGERRWLPIGIGLREGFTGVNVPEIARLCEPFWAEGRDRYLADGIAWRDAERLARDVHGLYSAEDSWRSAVSRWLDNPDMTGMTPRSRPWMTLHEVAEGALSMPPKHVKFSDQRRLGRVMREEGFILTPRKIGGRSVKVWSSISGREA